MRHSAINKTKPHELDTDISKISRSDTSVGA